jgi:hypothetical protein
VNELFSVHPLLPQLDYGVLWFSRASQEWKTKINQALSTDIAHLGAVRAGTA